MLTLWEEVCTEPSISVLTWVGNTFGAVVPLKLPWCWGALCGWLFPCNSALSVGYTRCCASVPAAGNAFCQAAKLHMQLQSKHDSATSFVDAGNAYKKADPQGMGDEIQDCFVQIFLAAWERRGFRSQLVRVPREPPCSLLGITGISSLCHLSARERCFLLVGCGSS